MRIVRDKSLLGRRNTGRPRKRMTPALAEIRHNKEGTGNCLYKKKEAYVL